MRGGRWQRGLNIARCPEQMHCSSEGNAREMRSWEKMRGKLALQVPVGKPDPYQAKRLVSSTLERKKGGSVSLSLPLSLSLSLSLSTKAKNAVDVWLSERKGMKKKKIKKKKYPILVRRLKKQKCTINSPIRIQGR